MLGGNFRRFKLGRREDDASPAQAAAPGEAPAVNDPGEPIYGFPEDTLSLQNSHEVGELMAAINAQSNELSAEFSRIASWSMQLDLLMTRTATMQQLLPRFIDKSQEQTGLIHELNTARIRQEREIAGLQTDLAHYRPLAQRQEEELHKLRAAYELTQHSLATLEGEHAKLQGEINQLLQKLSQADLRIHRLSEERQVLEQSLAEKSLAQQGLSRDVALLRSDLVASKAENDRLQRDMSLLTQKMAEERRGAQEVETLAQSRTISSSQMIRELEAQLAAAAERERKLIEDLARSDKQSYDFGIRLSALQSKTEFLTGVNAKLREDLRHHIDHVGTLEQSNRQLIAAMTRSREEMEREPEADAEQAALKAS